MIRRLFILLLIPCLLLSCAAADETLMVTGGMLRLREAPDFNAAVLGRYDTGTLVTAGEKTGDWYAVTLPDGLMGYMHAAYLVPPKTQGDTLRVVSDNGGAVNLRAAASLHADVMTAVPAGTQVTVLLRGDTWSCITCPGGQTGYMMTRFLAQEAGSTLYVTSTNGGGVNMRAAASQQSRSLGVLRVGTAVTLIGAGDQWHHIRHGSHDGWMMARYLTANAPETASPAVASVTVDESAPRVGSVLTANVRPNSVQCVFIWTDDAGRVLGTGRTYTVRAEDAGQCIRVTATGFGTTTGAAVSAVCSPVKR